MKSLARGITRLTEQVFVKGEGCYLYNQSGEKFLDFTCGIGVTNIGHCHPRVVAAAQEQVGNLIHGQINIGYHQPMLDLINILLDDKRIGLGDLDSLFFTTTGAEGIENAIKLARDVTRKQGIISFKGGFHGRTVGTLSVTASNVIYKQHFGPFMPGTYIAPFPYELHGYSVEHCLRELNLLLKQQVHPDDVAAVLIEPILGEGGYVPAPDSFLIALREFCTKHKFLLICDEIQSGFGRTGKYFAFQHARIQPDIVVMAKGLASGFPLAAVASRKSYMDIQEPGSMGGTYAGNIVSCAAAIATQKVIEEDGIIENSRIQGAYLFSRLKDLQKRNSKIRDVRGKGCMIGVEFVEDLPYGSKTKVVKQCAKAHLLLLGTSIFETVRFIPPLIVTKEQIDMAVDTFEKSINEVL